LQKVAQQNSRRQRSSRQQHSDRKKHKSRAQSTIALSSAEAELYAINTGAEALHIRSSLTEALNRKKVNIRIHTDSSSGKSIATRIESSKKAKHIELKHLFIQ